MSRKMGIGAALAATAVALSGCVAFAAPPTAKLKNGNVVITVQARAWLYPEHDGTFQVFLGFRVPSKAKPPQSFSGTGPASGGLTLSFTKSSSYTGQLASLAHTPAGQKWVGYWSQDFYHDHSSGPLTFTAKPAFGLRKNFSGEFKNKAIVGGRELSAPNPSLAVSCKPLRTMHSGPDGLHVICESGSAFGSLAIHR